MKVLIHKEVLDAEKVVITLNGNRYHISETNEDELFVLKIGDKTNQITVKPGHANTIKVQ